MDYAGRRLVWNVAIADILDDRNCNRSRTTTQVVTFVEPAGLAHNDCSTWVCLRNGLGGDT